MHPRASPLFILRFSMISFAKSILLPTSLFNDYFMRIYISLKSSVGNRVHFANEIMLNRKRNKGGARVHYKLIKYKKKGDYKIL